jgi:hypothetical protein
MTNTPFLLYISTSSFRIVAIIVIALIIFFLVYDVGMKEPYNLVSLAGLAAYIILFYILSYSPAAVSIMWNEIEAL